MFANSNKSVTRWPTSMETWLQVGWGHFWPPRRQSRSFELPRIWGGREGRWRPGWDVNIVLDANQSNWCMIAITSPPHLWAALLHMVFISGFRRLGGSEGSFPVVAKSPLLQKENERNTVRLIIQPNCLSKAEATNPVRFLVILSTLLGEESSQNNWGINQDPVQIWVSLTDSIRGGGCYLQFIWRCRRIKPHQWLPSSVPNHWWARVTPPPS